MKNRKPEVGNVLYMPKSRFSIGGEITVKKVGRRWAYFGKHDWDNQSRFDIKTWIVDSGGYGMAQYIYESESAYTEERSRLRVLGSISKSASRSKAPMADVLRAAELLGIEA